MNITKDIINDLIPLYITNECSADTRALVEEYLKANPGQAQRLGKVMDGSAPALRSADEMRAFREARRRLRYRTWLMAFAIFFSLLPFSFGYVDGHWWWLLRDGPRSALVYGVIGVVLWTIYIFERHKSRSL
jgi:hypothetical protein